LGKPGQAHIFEKGCCPEEPNASREKGGTKEIMLMKTLKRGADKRRVLITIPERGERKNNTGRGRVVPTFGGYVTLPLLIHRKVVRVGLANPGGGTQGKFSTSAANVHQSLGVSFGISQSGTREPRE